MTIPIDQSKAPNARAAAERLAQLKQQLTMTPSSMSLQAPKDMARERAATDFHIDTLAYYWAGDQDQYRLMVMYLY